MTIWAAIIKSMKERVVSASEFKAKCLAYLTEIEQSGESITVTRRGKPVAVLGPAKRGAPKSPANSLAGKIRIVGDIVHTNWVWDATEPE